MDFIEYLHSKKIDSTQFKEGLPEQFIEWSMMFNQIHPESFTQQKLFLINNLRRKYSLKKGEEVKKPSGSKMTKPKIKPKTK